MTVDEAQGLTLRRVGVHVEEDVFSHGQLYVAFSRCGDPVNPCVFGPPPEADGAVWIKNVVQVGGEHVPVGPPFQFLFHSHEVRGLSILQSI